MLNCNCTHPRKEHLGGIKFLNNKHVENCLVQGCLCKHYSSDETSQKREMQILTSSLFTPLFIGVSIIGIAFLLGFVSNYMVDSYDIHSKTETKLVYLNGTDYPSTSVSPNERLKENLQVVTALPFGYLGVIITLSFAMAKYEMNRKALIAE